MGNEMVKAGGDFISEPGKIDEFPKTKKTCEICGDCFKDNKTLLNHVADKHKKTASNKTKKRKLSPSTKASSEQQMKRSQSLKGSKSKDEVARRKL